MSQPRRIARGSVVHMTSLHPALDSRVFYNQCASLVRCGFDVSLIAPAIADFTKDGVRVQAIRVSRGVLGRVLNSFRVFRLALKNPADIYHFHDPELIPFALTLRLLGRRVVMDIHEDQPGAMLHSRPSVPRRLRPFLASVIAAVEEFSGRMMSGVVATTHHISYRFPVEKTVVVENFPDTSDAPIAHRLTFQERRNEAVLTGTLGDLQCIPEMVEGFSSVAQELGITLSLAGKFVPESLQESVLGEGRAQAVRFLGWQPRETVYELLSHAKAGFVPYRSNHASPEFSSRKMYEYLAFGIPLIVSNVRSWSQIVTDHQCGVVLKDCSPSSFAEALRAVFASPAAWETMSRNARNAYETSLNGKVALERLVALYEKLLAE
jgi:glycosyltransferase involved in cell wall biosynthesis